MRGVLAAARAELVQLDAIWIVATVLFSDVIAFLAISACKRDLGTNVRSLAHGDAFRSALVIGE